MKTERNAAKIVGFSIVIMTVAAGIANDVTIGKLLVPGNAYETYQNIYNSPSLFRVGVICWLVILLADIFAAWGLYLFFRPINDKISQITAWFRIVYVAVLGSAILNLIKVLMFFNGEDYLTNMATEHLHTQVLFYINSFYSAFSFGLIIFAFHVLFLGYLLLSLPSKAPKIFGVLLILAFIGYTLTNTGKILFPQYNSILKTIEIIFFIPMLGEVAMGIWLLIIGFRKKSIYLS